VPLPFAERAVLDRRKVDEYLLAERHPVGRHKARVFRALGYSTATADQLIEDLLAVARNGHVVAISNTGFGLRYIVDAAVTTPAGSAVVIRTCWIIPHRTSTPQFVTAYALIRSTP
jgi:hypothetical protein